MAQVSYSAKITNAYRILDGTVRYYRDAVRYLAGIIMPEYDLLSTMDGPFVSHQRQLLIESWIHGTSRNTPRFREFDRRFYKFPSYLRRSVILDAYGIIDSYKKLTKLWEDDGCPGKRPRMNLNQCKMPCFYRGNMYICFTEKPDHVYKDNQEEWNIKVWHNHDWVWIPIVLKTSDVRYLREHCRGLKASAPVLEKRSKSYCLRFTYQRQSEGTFVKDVDVKRVVGVDLGVNTDAVCSLVEKDGTVAARKFINSPAEKDRLYTDLRVIKSAQKHGNIHNPRLWRFVHHYNDAIEITAARGIVSFAVQHHAQVIVFEHLDMRGKKIHGSMAQRITLWRKNSIQNRVEAEAARFGIRTAHVCAANTSALAFDGSGAVTRDPFNHSLCTFQTGKQYNCDLSASYNIAARYYIRALMKTTPAKKWLSVSAKVPGLDKRTTCTLSTLIHLAAEFRRCSV